MRLLVVEDEPEVSAFLLRVLREAAWAADVARTGAQALKALASLDYDLVILDLGLPDMDGFDLCRLIRERGDRTPVLMLTARDAVNDRVRGLDAGADDYLAKPFAVSELLARLRSLARRPVVALEPVLKIADLQLDPSTRGARRGTVEIALTSREYALLEYLMRNPRTVLSRAKILGHVWNDEFEPVANAVDVLVGRLRRKVDLPGLAALVLTVRGSGYAITDRARSAPSGA